MAAIDTSAIIDQIYRYKCVLQTLVAENGIWTIKWKNGANLDDVLCV